MQDLQKLKLLYLLDFLMKESDEQHPVSMREILAHLASRGVTAERKSVYADLDTLEAWGLDVVRTGPGRYAGYFVGQRTFQLPELKLLVDSVQCSRFITRDKTRELIRKLETLAGSSEARQLRRQVIVPNRIKQVNETIYYGVDQIHNAISENRQILFRYFRYTELKTRKYGRDGADYRVSPYALTFDNENYYLVAYDGVNREIRHYRVDRMEDIREAEEEREGQEAFEALDMGAYSRQVFGMFTGETEQVTMQFSNALAGAVLDRLGMEAMLIPEGKDRFRVTAEVAVSPQFFAWVFGFGGDARILAPAEVAQEMGRYAAEVAGMYR